jgi:sarcosine oxidase subunit alpha
MNGQPNRLAHGGAIDRSGPIAFTFNGRRLHGYAGDTLASALLANGVAVVGRSFKYHRPRGIYGAGVEEPNAIVDLVHNGRHDPNAKATLVELAEGMIVRSVNCWPSVERDVYGGLDLLHRFLPSGFYYKTFMRPSWHAHEPYIRKLAGLGREPL